MLLQMGDLLGETKFVSYRNLTFAYMERRPDSAFPPWLVSINQAWHRLSPQDCFFPMKVGKGEIFVFAFAGDNAQNRHLWRLGTHFLKNYYVVLDAESSEVTLAK